jgi:hypothetical protein
MCILNFICLIKSELLLNESVFLNRSLYQEAERHYSLRSTAVVSASAGAVQAQVGKARDLVSAALGNAESVRVADLVQRLSEVELENKALRSTLERLEARLSKLDGAPTAPVAAAAAPAKPAAAPAKEDDFDLFDEDEDDEAAQKLKEERVKAYSEKKAKSNASKKLFLFLQIKEFVTI